MKKILISPSILSADFSQLGRDISILDNSSCEYIHIDVMDGSFVSNISFGSDVQKSIRHLTNKVFDTHLMVNDSIRYIENFVDAGSNIISVHVEAEKHIHATLQKIKSCGVKSGVAINPGTPIETIFPIMDMVDQVIVMTVNPGFGGQAFISSQLDKISKLKRFITDNNLNVDIEIDGGINEKTGKLCVDAGANILVAGSFVFNNGIDNIENNIQKLK